MIQPPKVGPIVGASDPDMPRIAAMRPVWGRGTAQSRGKHSWDHRPADKSWIARMTIMVSMLVANPQPILAR